MWSPPTRPPLPTSTTSAKVSRRTHLVTPISWGDYQQEVNQQAFTQVTKFALLLGTIVVNQEPYLLVASGAESIATYI